MASAVILGGAAGLGRPVRDVSWYQATLDGTRQHLVVCDHHAVTPTYRLDALICRAQRAGVAALLISVHSSVPPLSSVRLADRCEMPVLAVRDPDLVPLLHRLTIRVRAPHLARAQLIEEVVHQLAGCCTGEEIVQSLQRVLSGEVSLLSLDGTAILGEPIAGSIGLRSERPVPQRTQMDGIQFMAQPIIDPRAAQPLVWLCCTVAGNDPGRADAAAAALAVAEPFMRAWLVGERASVAADQASRTHLLAEIMTGQDAVRRDVVEAAVSLGWRMHDWHVGIHVLRDLGTDQPSTEIIIRQLQAQLARHGVATVDGVDRGDGWAVWVSRAAEPGPDDGRSILRISRVALAALPREWSLSAGIGRPYRGPKGLGETLAEARDAAYLARTRSYRPAAEHVDEAGVARLLAIWQQSEVVKSFAETALAPLRDKDEASLLATLRAYLEAGGSVVETAQVLGVHRNTVTARVHRLKERLGLNLDDPNQRLALQLACRAFTVQS